MMRGTVLGLGLGLLLLGCPSDDEMNDEGGSGPTSMSTTMPSTTAGTGTTTASETGDDSASASMSSSPTGDEEGSSSEGGCPGDDPFPTTEVEGCGDPLGEPFCSEGGSHVEEGSEIEWGNNPPHSGDHYPSWESWGEHEETVPRGNWVHNMEHGGIVLAYLCPNDSCPKELEVLRQVIEDRPEARILMTSDPELPGEGFAAISWTWVYMFDEPDLDTLLCFVDQHFNHAPEDVP